MTRPAGTSASIHSAVATRFSAVRCPPRRGTQGAGVLAGFVAIAVCAIGAGALLRLAERSDGSTGFDRRIISWVVAHRSAGATTLARSFSLIGSTKFLLPVVVCVALGLAWRRRLALAGLVVVAWGGSIGLYNLTKVIVERPRPPQAIRLASAAGSSLPSGHAAQSLATYVALAVVAAAVLPRVSVPARVLAVILAAGVGCSRVYLGVHWATDVGAGWMAAGLWIIVVLWAAAPARAPEQPLSADRAGRRWRPDDAA